MNDAPSVTLAQLPELRRKTERISKLLSDQLVQYLETLRPLLNPERAFGRYAGGKGDSAEAEQCLAELQAKYKEVIGKSLHLPPQFDTQWLSLVGNRVELIPYEYVHRIESGAESKAITMSSPAKWIFNYVSGMALMQVVQAVAAKDPRRQDSVRQFAVNALVAQVVLARNPGLVRLLADLRYEVKVEPCANLNMLPLVTLAACVPSFRPPDELILAATGFSGVPAFIELIGSSATENLSDPFKKRLEEAAR
jgi:hypothetical protein